MNGPVDELFKLNEQFDEWMEGTCWRSIIRQLFPLFSNCFSRPNRLDCRGLSLFFSISYSCFLFTLTIIFLFLYLALCLACYSLSTFIFLIVAIHYKPHCHWNLYTIHLVIHYPILSFTLHYYPPYYLLPLLRYFIYYLPFSIFCIHRYSPSLSTIIHLVIYSSLSPTLLSTIHH